MKKYLLLLVACVFVFCIYTASADTNSLKSERQISNFVHQNYEVYGDSLAVTTSEAVLVFQSLSYNIEMTALDGDVLFKFSKNTDKWPKWHRLPENWSKSLSVGDLDSLVYKTATGTAALQVMQSVWQTN